MNQYIQFDHQVSDLYEKLLDYFDIDTIKTCKNLIKGHLREFSEIKIDNNNSYVMNFFNFNIDDLFKLLKKIK